jgi:hypothetical protein
VSKREDQAFKAWVEEIKATLPDEDAVEAFEVFAGTDTGRDVFRGTIREDDYYRKLNKLAEEKKEFETAKEELTEWFENEEPVREALLKERDELRKKLAEGKSDSGDPPNPVTGISPEEFALIRAKAAKVDAIDKILPSVLGDWGRVLMDAQRNNFDFDPNEVMQTSVQQGIDPMRAYLQITADQRKAREAQAAEEQKKKWFEEGRRAALSGDAPDHLKPSGPSIFDTLTAREPETGITSVPQNTRARVDEAVRQYLEGET